MMKKLHNKGFVVYEKYGGVSLTPRGKDIAEPVKKRYHTFKKFLELVLVPEDIASKDAPICLNIRCFQKRYFNSQDSSLLSLMLPLLTP
jgi:hypothetical protein